MRTCWTSLCAGNVMEVPLPQLCQVCVAILLSSTLFKILRPTICWSTSPTVFAFVFSTIFFLNHQLSRILSPGKHCRSIIGSRDTSHGRWEWSVAVVWLPDFVARLVRQVRLIPAPYLCGVHKPCPLLREETVPAERIILSTHDFACPLVLFPDQWAWYLAWERECMWHAYIIRKWRPSQRAAAAVCWKSLALVQLKL